MTEWPENDHDHEIIGCQLREAACAGNVDNVLRIVVQSVDVNSPDLDQQTALHHAAERGHVHCVKVLLAAGATPDQRDKDGLTPFDKAQGKQHTECAQLLIGRESPRAT